MTIATGKCPHCGNGLSRLVPEAVEIGQILKRPLAMGVNLRCPINECQRVIAVITDQTLAAKIIDELAVARGRGIRRLLCSPLWRGFWLIYSDTSAPAAPWPACGLSAPCDQLASGARGCPVAVTAAPPDLGPGGGLVSAGGASLRCWVRPPIGVRALAMRPGIRGPAASSPRSWAQAPRSSV